jgi:hypothetical protein
MLLLTQGNTDDKIVVTLQEKTTILNPYYLFVFEHVTNKYTVTLVRGQADDLSEYPERYNEFTIDTEAEFGSKALGQWLYKVYEQSDPDNNSEIGLNEVERGKMLYIKAEDFEYKKYATATAFKTYGG